MNSSDQYELYLIKCELQNIINELDSIAYGVRRDFSNIGNEQCASCVSKVAEKYRYVKRKLDNIDTNKVTDEYLATHSGGGVR